MLSRYETVDYGRLANKNVILFSLLLHSTHAQIKSWNFRILCIWNQKCHFVLSSLTLYTCADEILKFQDSVYMKSKMSFCSDNKRVKKKSKRIMLSCNTHGRIKKLCSIRLEFIIKVASQWLVLLSRKMMSFRKFQGRLNPTFPTSVSDPEHRQPSHTLQ